MTLRPMLIRFIVGMIMCFMAFGSLGQPTTQKIALVLGNAAYVDPNLRLDNPVNDMEAMSDKLMSLGFTSFAIANFTKSSFDLEFQQFLTELRQIKQSGQAVIVTIFYAGHGIQYRRENYLIPVDTRLMQEAQIDEAKINDEFISLAQISALIAEEDPELAIVILDACRDLPFEALNNRIGGWTNIVKSNFFVAFGTGPGEQAFDGFQNGNSVFVSSILKHIDTQGLNLAQLFQRVRVDVMLATDGMQVPQESSRAVVDFTFKQAASTTLRPNHSLMLMLGIAVLSVILVGSFIFNKVTRRDRTTKRRSKLQYVSLFSLVVSVGLFVINRHDYQSIRHAIFPLDPLLNNALEQGVNGTAFSQTDGTVYSQSNGIVFSRREESERLDKIEPLPLSEITHSKANQNRRYVPDTDERGLKRRQGGENNTEGVQSDNSQGGLLAQPLEAELSKQTPLDVQIAQRNARIVEELLNQMIRLESGQLELGSTQFGAASKPVVMQSVAGFSLLSHEVTADLYQVCVDDKFCTAEQATNDIKRPVEEFANVANKLAKRRPIANISYNQVTTEFLPWLNQLSSIQFRLPSEVEWEYAATYKHHDPFNDALRLGQVTANCSDCFGRSFGQRSAPIKSYTPTQYGFYDLLGNVSEWVASCWTDNYQAQYYGEPWPDINQCNEVVVRGGAWHQSMKEISPMTRRKMKKSRQSSAIGFRLAR